MRFRDVLSFAVLGAISVVAIVYIGSFGVRVGPPPERTSLSMDVPYVNDLQVGASVLLRGVPVGKVTAIESGGSSATINFYVDSAHQIPIDSDVRIDNLSALGETFIGLAPRTGSGPMLKDGQHVATESVVAPPSISELATSVVRVLNQLDPGALKRIVGEMDSGLPDPVAVLPNLARTSVLLQNTVTGMRGRGQEVLDNFQVLLQNAGWVGPVLADLGPELRSMIEHYRDTYNMLQRVVLWDNPSNLNLDGQLLARVQKFLDDRGPDIKVLSEAMAPKVSGIAGALMNFDSGQILANVLSAFPEDGAIQLHVRIPEG